jgi:hypothetical protein
MTARASARKQGSMRTCERAGARASEREQKQERDKRTKGKEQEEETIQA